MTGDGVAVFGDEGPVALGILMEGVVCGVVGVGDELDGLVSEPVEEDVQAQAEVVVEVGGGRRGVSLAVDVQLGVGLAVRLVRAPQHRYHVLRG